MQSPPHKRPAAWRDAALGGGGQIGHALEGAVLDRSCRTGRPGSADELGAPLGQGPQGLLELLPFRQVEFRTVTCSKAT